MDKKNKQILTETILCAASLFLSIWEFSRDSFIFGVAWLIITLFLVVDIVDIDKSKKK